MRGVTKILAVLTWLVIVPTPAFAQASITGVVQDTSGAVVPGVTVEAASPALIEKVRSVVTDGSAQYRIVDLRPGTYAVTFTLPGFNTVRREGIELTGSFTATVNADLRPGALEETVTVTGEAPIVDVQSASQERVITHEVGDALPTARMQFSFAVLIPGVSVTPFSNVSGMGSQDVGGSTGDQIVTLRIHGGRSADQRLMVNGLPVGRVDMPELGAYSPDMSATQEIQVETGGFSAETAVGGLRLYIVPRDGGNTFSGTVFGSYASEQLASSNLTDDLKAHGLLQANSIKRNGDFNPGFGGPIKRDKLWFYLAGRYMFYDNYAAGMFVDSTRNDPKVWTFNPDRSRPGLNSQHVQDGQGRLTWQATPKHNVAFSYVDVGNCKCSFNLSPTVAEASRTTWRLHQITGNWTAPLTNRLLFEAALLGNLSEHQQQGFQPDLNPLNISVTEQSTNLSYKAPVPAGSPNAGNFTDGKTHKTYYRAALSYITGAHALKVGFSNGTGFKDSYNYALNDQFPYSYRFNLGAPNRINLFAKPYHDYWNLDSDLAIYAQDKWTVDRLTLNGGVLYSYYKSSFSENHYLPTALLPNRDFVIPDTPQLAWKDVTPRLGAGLDLFGNGKTAVKVSLNKYLYGEAIATFWGTPALDLVNTTFRSWTDSNRNFVPDCDLAAPAQNGECGPLADANFGKAIKATTYDPDVKFGWGKRPFNWEFSAGVQHQLLPRVSAEVSYFRRWYGNFVLGGGRGGDTQLLGAGTASDNRNVGPSDLDPFCVTVPANPGLPNGGGNQICGLYDLNPAKFGVPANNYVTFSSNYGKQVEHWNGVDVVLNARLAQGVLLQGGLSTGRTLSDVCEIVAKLPEVFVTPTLTPQQYCRVQTPFQTQAKLLGSYTIPRVDVQVSGTFQSVPGPQLSSNLNVPSAVVAQSLGRPLSGNAANATVNLIPPATIYGDRLNQVDLRFSKMLRFRTKRTALNFDLYNALNASPVLTYSSAYATFLQPQQVLGSRFGKVSVQFNF
jgi:hypothetical protein